MEELANIMGLEHNVQNFIPLFHKGEKTKDTLSVIPEQSIAAKQLKFNCAIQKPGDVAQQYIEFYEEEEFFEFMANYNPNKNYCTHYSERPGSGNIIQIWFG